SFAVHAGSCVWRLLSSSVAMRRREKECAPRVSFPAGVEHRVWLVWWVLAPCALCSGRGFWPFPVGCGNKLVGDGGGYLLLHGGWLLALCAFLAWMPSRGV
ncbi:trans-sialidase, partial [Trypanosoma cruzi]